MTTQRALSGVSHDIAHHAVSGLSYIHPHLYHACQLVGVRQTTIDILVESPYPTGLPQLESLRLSLVALREKFFAILEANDFGTTDVKSLSISFEFPLVGADGYSCQVVSRLQSSRGHNYTTVIE